MTSLGNNIRKLRKEQSYNQMDLATILGVSQTSIAHYEAGTRQPTIETLMKLSKVFNKSIDSLVGHAFASKSNHKEVTNQSALIESLVDCLVTKDEKEFMAIFNNSVYSVYDIHVIINSVLNNVMYQIGTLWEQGIVSEADEHYATNVVRKAMNLISINNGEVIKNRKAITFSIASEKHTLGIEMINTYLESEGIDSLYLGSNVPIRSINKLLTEYDPNYIFISMTMADNMNSLIHFIDYINEKHPNKFMIGVGGQGLLHNADIKETSHVRILKNTEALKSLLSE